MPSFGNASPMLGGTAGLARSIAAGAPALNQQSPMSASFAPNLVVPARPENQGSPMMSPLLAKALKQQQGIMGNMPPAPEAEPLAPMPATAQPSVTLPAQDRNPQQPGVQVPENEARLIVRALIKQLDTINKKETQAQGAQNAGMAPAVGA